MVNTPTFYLQAHHAYHSDGVSDAELRSQLKALGVDGRRLSRLTLLSLLGALPLSGAASSSLYLASPASSPSKYRKLLDQLVLHNTPNLLDFTASLHNAAVFHVAQALSLQGASAFVPSTSANFFQILYLAVCELLDQPSHDALLGWGLEQGEEAQDGSHWYRLSTQPSAHALARLQLVPTPEDQPLPTCTVHPDFWQSMQAWQHAVHHGLGYTLPIGNPRWVMQLIPA